METRLQLIKCLICGQDKDKCNIEEQLKDNCNEGSLISKHLQVIFLLRNILEVPSYKLVVFLKSHPNVESWLSVCDKCSERVAYCKSSYQAILEAQRKFRSVKSEVIQLLKESALIKREISQEELDGFQDSQLDIVEEIRGFVYQNEYPKNADPFISGDHMAYQKLSHQIDKAMEELEEEENDYIDNQCSGANDDLPDDQPEDEEWSLSDSDIQQADIDMGTTEQRFSAKCDLCGALYLNHSKLLIHQSKCTGKSIPCPAPSCPRKFSNDQVLTRHLRQYHGSGGGIDGTNPSKLELSRTTCEFCGRTFPKITLLKKHTRSVHDQSDNTFKCDLCGIGRRSQLDLQEHRKNCKGHSLSCPLATCHMKCSNYTTLNYHVRTTHKDNLDDHHLFPFRCLECEGDNNVFLSATQLKTHMSKKHPGYGKGDRCDKGLGPFVCETCGETYQSKYSLTNHRNKNTKCKRLRGMVKEVEVGEEKPLICDICGASFKGKGGLQMHVKVVHERRFVKTCDICGKGVNGKGRLELHMWQSHKVGDGKRWRCGVDGCTVQLFGGRDREDHMKEHRGEEMGYRCDECGKGFYMEGDLRQHGREVHRKGEKGKRGRKGRKVVKIKEERVEVEEDEGDNN